ncbi:hypothetical protein GZH53_01130 [Flavihumibacter sp. R14]|nr:hypothetical protein [Flavihumibacter soli]
MKFKIASIIYLSLIATSCTTKPTKTNLKEPVCKVGLMGPGIYELGTHTSIPNIEGLKEGFSIIIDTNYKAVNLSPFREEYVISQIKDPMSYRFDDSAWLALPNKIKLREIQKAKEDWKKEISRGIKKFNDGKQIVWLINRTSDTFTLQTRIFDLMAIQEAKDLNGIWRPIEYLGAVIDNFQFGYKKIPPLKAGYFKVVLPNQGNFSTKLRYKILGKERFYYSPEFAGKIKYCQFTQDTTETGRKAFMLERFYNYVE